MPSGKIRSMAGARMDGGVGGGGSGGAEAADIREPLRSLYQNSSPNDPGLQEQLPSSKTFPVSSKNFQTNHRPFVFGSLRNASRSRSASPDAEDAVHSSAGGALASAPDAGHRPRMSSNRGSSNTPGGYAEGYLLAPSRAASECSEIQNVDDYESSPMSMSEGSQSFSDSQLITDVEDNENLMQLKLEAMTWAAMAKDFTISSLEKRLRKALQIAKAEQMKNVELETALDQSKQELSRAKEDIAKLEEAEERLVREHGELQVDASNHAAERTKLQAEQTRRHRAQLLMLEHRIRLMLGDKEAGKRQDRHSQDSYGGWQVSDAEILEQELESSQHRERSLTEKYSEAEQEIEELQRELTDARTDLRVSEVLRKTQSRRLKVLEKERRHLLRRGALRTVKLAPRTQRRANSSIPGGPGWNVFSVLEYAEP